ncbi:MAG: U32 family peptidase [Clostridia bacterium]|nr:U32 family peptidase [Clostridia bacterium]
MMELLSPAGSPESLTAAVQNGADAVYFGGSMLNARRFAGNFAGDALVSALDYCHERNVRAYITLNTLVFDRELRGALDFAEQLIKYGADAVLVQDLGLASLIRHELPELTVHASTQMGIHDIGGLKYCESIGVKRAVLAREVSLKQLRALSSGSRVELEVFGHGALCMSFSGSCLYSSMAGERSGNRGTCAQPCRKAASISGKPGSGDFCLSPNDICMIEHLKELEAAGACCIKLEGRMKKPEYVAAVTACYRAALDGASAAEIAEMKRRMFRMFNRGEFSTSHFFGDSVRTDRVGSSKPEQEDVSEAKRNANTETRLRPIEMRLSLEVGKPAVLWAKCGENTAALEGETVSKAQKPQQAQTYIDRLAKLGGTPLELKQCDIRMSEDCYLSAAALNALRREAAEKLLSSFHVRNTVSRIEGSLQKQKTSRINAEKGLKDGFSYAVVPTIECAEAAFTAGADAVALEFNASKHADKLQNYRANGKKLLLALPNVLITEKQRAEAAALIDSGLFDGAEANNVGQIDLVSELDIRIAGIGLNAMNSYTISELLSKGFDYVIPSVELTGAQLAPLAAEYGDRLILWIHGRVPLMQLLHCPVREHRGCRNCSGDAGTVTDEAGRQFPLANIRFSDGCLVRLLNCSTTDLIDLLPKLPSAAGYRLYFTCEKQSAVGERVRALSAVKAGAVIDQYPDSTRGHLNRKVD